MAADVEPSPSFGLALLKTLAETSGSDTEITHLVDSTAERLQVTPSVVYETIAAYLPHLNSCRLERLLREPALLSLEEERLASQLEKLAISHYRTFISSNKVIRNIGSQMHEISDRLHKAENCLQPLKKALADLHVANSSLSEDAENLQRLLLNQTSYEELLEIPAVLEACRKSHCFDSGLDLLAHTDKIVHGLRSWAILKNGHRQASTAESTNAENAIQRSKLPQRTTEENKASPLSEGRQHHPTREESSESERNRFHENYGSNKNLHQGRNCHRQEIRLLRWLELRVAEERRKLKTTLLRRLDGDVHLPESVKIIGHLRRLQVASRASGEANRNLMLLKGGDQSGATTAVARGAMQANSGSPSSFAQASEKIDEQVLRAEFVERRGNFVKTQLNFVEALLPTNVGDGLRAAANVVRTHVCDVGLHYRALFGDTDGPIALWLPGQVEWLKRAMVTHLLPEGLRSAAVAGNDHLLSQSRQNRDRRKKVLLPSGTDSDADTSDNEDDGAEVKHFSINPFFLHPPVSASTLAALYRQTHHTSASLRRLHCSFFSSVAPIFDIYVESFVETCLGQALVTFDHELNRHHWTPTATAIGEEYFQADSNAGKDGTTEDEHEADPLASLPELMRRAMALTAHRPLAIFANELLSMLNELRQAAFYSVQRSTTTNIQLCMTVAARRLVRQGKNMGALDVEGQILTALPGTRGRSLHFRERGGGGQKPPEFDDESGREPQEGRTGSSFGVLRDSEGERDTAEEKIREFFATCQGFAEILTPLLSLQLAAIWGIREQEGLLEDLESSHGVSRLSKERILKEMKWLSASNC